MSVSYDSQKIIPAPFCSIQKETLAREDGAILSRLYIVTLQGKLVAYKGSPDSSGSFYNGSGYPADEIIGDDSMMGAILRKQEALRVLFSNDGRSLEVQPYDGMPPMKCRPRVKRVEFQQGQWFNTCDYTITMEADYVEGLADASQTPTNDRVTKVSQEWNMEVLDEAKRTYRLTHSLSATGKRLFDETGQLFEGKEAWEHARDYVLLLNSALPGFGLGLNPDRMTAPDVLNTDSLQAFNLIRTQAVNETAGIFTVTETWVCYDPKGNPPAINEYNVSSRYNIQDSRTTVSIAGTISGFDVYDNTHALVSSRWQNAEANWNNVVFPNLLSTVQQYVGVPLNVIPVANQVGFNPIAGTVTYQWEYDNRPTPMTPGALTESITVNNSNPAEIFAIVPVLGRPMGPIFQALGTTSPKSRNISIEILMPSSNQSFVSLSPNTTPILLTLMPISPLGVFMERDEETWTAYTGRYSRQTTYIWE